MFNIKDSHPSTLAGYNQVTAMYGESEHDAHLYGHILMEKWRYEHVFRSTSVLINKGNAPSETMQRWTNQKTDALHRINRLKQILEKQEAYQLFIDYYMSDQDYRMYLSACKEKKWTPRTRLIQDIVTN